MRFQPGSVVPDFRVELRAEEEEGGVLRPGGDEEAEAGVLGMVCVRVGDGCGWLA